MLALPLIPLFKKLSKSWKPINLACLFDVQTIPVTSNCPFVNELCQMVVGCCF